VLDASNAYPSVRARDAHLHVVMRRRGRRREAESGFLVEMHEVSGDRGRAGGQARDLERNEDGARHSINTGHAQEKS
jgi:hypothetical protein